MAKKMICAITAGFIFILLVGCNKEYKSTAVIDISSPVKAATAANTANAEVIKTLDIPEKPLLVQNTNTIGTELSVIDKTYSKQSKSLVAANKKIDKLTDSRYTWVSVLCLAAIGLGVFLVINGMTKIGIGVAGGAAGTLISTFAINALMQYLWVVGIGMALIVLVAFAYVVYTQLIKNKVIEQLVSTSQILKGDNEISEVVKKQIDVIQSAETKQAVKNIKGV